MQKSIVSSLTAIACFALIVSSQAADGQLLEQLLNRGNSNSNSISNNKNQVVDEKQDLQEQAQQRQPQGFRGMFKDMMSVNVPMFYDMVKDGSSMGINVLSGLVKVERGQEAERSGLTGPRPLSVRVFGVPVYERGRRVRPLDNGGDREGSGGVDVDRVDPNGYEPKVGDVDP